MTPLSLRAVLGVLLCVLRLSALAQGKAPAAEYATESNLAYYDDAALRNADDYQKSQCKLDLYHPINRPGFATVVWFHGGGLTGGSRSLPGLKNQEIALVSVGYRLSPPGKLPDFLEDAAAATAWVIRNIARYDGDPRKVFVAGHSAGAYLAAMIGMDPKWLAAHGLSHRQLAGLIPVSPQASTHNRVKELRGDTGPALRPLIDEYAPLYHVAKDLPPICLITGDRNIEFKSRVEENALLAVTLRNLGHPRVEFHEMGGLSHNTVAEGSMIIARQFVNTVAGEIPVNE